MSDQSISLFSKGTPVEHLRTLLSTSEGPRALDLWNELMKTIEREGDACLQFSSSLKNIKSSKLDHFLLVNAKDLSAEADQDDARWKQLCDAARTEMRADSKYRQTAAQTAKARERIGSLDKKESLAEKAPKSPQKANRAMNGMNKALGNMLSILPDGGEQAMQMFTPDTRRAVAERSLQEADEKELKGKRALDQAVALKARAMSFYKSKAEPLVKKYGMEEMSGMEDIKAAMESLVAVVETLREARYESILVLSRIGEKPLTAALLDVKEWADKTVMDISAKFSKVPSHDASSAVSGFMLETILNESDSAKSLVYFATQIGKTDSFETDTSEVAADKDDTSVNSANSTRSLESFGSKNDNVCPDTSSEKQHNARWLHKSLSTPIAKPDFKTNFRRFNSLGDKGKDDPDCSEAAEMDDATESSTVSTNLPPQSSKEESESELFQAFWPDHEGSPPGVTNSFACAFLPKSCKVENLSSVEHGRLFILHKKMVFVAWKGRKAIVPFSGVTSLEKQENLFNLAEDTFLVTAQKGDTQSTLLLGCFTSRDEVLGLLQNLVDSAKKEEAQAKKSQTGEVGCEGKSTRASAPVLPVAPDATVQKMETVLSKKLRGILIGRFHQAVWLGETQSADKCLYEQWLKKGNCYDISIGDWESVAGGYKGPWCSETYSHKRLLSFKIKRKAMVGPPVANVTQTQYIRLDEDRSVMQMTISFDGIPLSDCFSVEVRWVASRSGSKDISIQVGVEVEFQKSTLLKKQIRNGTLTETKPSHLSLFDFVKDVLSKEADVDETGGEEDDEGVDATEDLSKAQAQEGSVSALIQSYLPGVVKDNLHIVGPIAILLVILLLRRILFSSSIVPAQNVEVAHLNERIDELQKEMKLMRQAIEEIAGLMREQNGAAGRVH
jgi:hypothetical protein